MDAINTAITTIRYPRVEIHFCTQCKWLLRAAYYAQELLSTFSTYLGEVALVPSVGGKFQIFLLLTPEAPEIAAEKKLLWDRKVDDGFPETKELKKRVRDIIDPGRDLGHVDGKKSVALEAAKPQEKVQERKAEIVDTGAAGPACKIGGEVCEDCA